MKRISNKVSIILASGIAAVLAFLTTGCKGENGVLKEFDETEERLEYGCPWAEYTIKAKVTGEEARPIEGIEVSAQLPQSTQGKTRTFKKGTTNANGDVVLSWDEMPEDRLDLVVVARDIDGEKNGSWETSNTNITLRLEEKPNTDEWYEGSASKEITIKLTPKKTNK